jgi:hypothetical protein
MGQLIDVQKDSEPASLWQAIDDLFKNRRPE